MRTIRVIEHISLDGIIGPDWPGINRIYADGEWTAPYRCEDGALAIAQAQGHGFDLLLGRRTYDVFAGFWPTVKEGPFAIGLNKATKYVVTHRPESITWGPVGVLAPDCIKGISKLKAMEGPDLLVWGSSTVTVPLFEQGLVDELVLVVYPVLLGQGKRCFPQGNGHQRFKLTSTMSTPTGVCVNKYIRMGTSTKLSIKRK